MGSFKRGAKHQLESNKALTSSFTTAVTNIESLPMLTYIIQCENVTSNQGEFTVEGRISVGGGSSSDWVTIEPLTNGTLTLTDQDHDFFVAIETSCTEVRVKFTPSNSNDGTCNIFIQATSLK